MSTNYSTNAAGISRIARHSWAADLPVSFALQQCIELGFYRVHIKRFIETIYEQQQTEIDSWWRYAQAPA